MESMRTDQEAYRRAVDMNDIAHRQTIKEVANATTSERQEVFAEINREARLWLRHLDSIHYRV